MKTGYHIDLSRISLDEFQRTLSSGNVLPSRQILKEDLEKRFNIIRSLGIKDMEQLLDEMKNKKKVEVFAERTGLPLDYLTILRREVNSYLSKPISLSKVPDVEQNVLEKLASIGIKNSQHMYERGLTRPDREDIAAETGLSMEIIIELVKMSDLSRIQGVGPVFTRTLLNSGFDTVAKVADSDPEVLFETSAKAYLDQGFEKVDFVLRDIEWCIEMANKLPITIEW